MKKYILILLLFSPVIFADIFKCKNESGITAFQSQPCDENVKQEVIKAKRRYRDVTDVSALSGKDIDILFDDLMAGDEYATKLYIKYLEEHGEELFKEEEPVSEEVIQSRRLQRSIDEQNKLLRDQSIMQQQQSNFERDESLRKQEQALRKLKRQQEEALRELTRKQQESIYKDEQRKQEEDNQRFYDKQEQDNRDYSIQRRLDDIEYGIRGY